MNRIIFFAVFGFEIFAIDLIKTKECVTPYKENATCILISTCDVVSSALYTLTPRAIQFYKDSQCGCDAGMVCCGSSNDKLYPPLINCVPVSQPKKINLLSISDQTVCGLPSSTDKVLGGSLVKEEEFPWLVALEYRNKFSKENAGIRCGGSLISKSFVLTAAHCILNAEFEIIKVWLGVTNITSEETCSNNYGNRQCIKTVLKLNVAETIPHEFYNSIKKSNDIGLLKLEVEVEFSNYIRPICLPARDAELPSIGTYLTVAGWGVTENGKTSEAKLKVQVPLRDYGICGDYLIKHYQNITSKQLCVGGERGKDSCEGDSGGPLMYDVVSANGDVQWVQEGIVSYGTGSMCGVQGRPGVYININSYTRWIYNKHNNIQGSLEEGEPCTFQDGTLGICAQPYTCSDNFKQILTKSEFYRYKKTMHQTCGLRNVGELLVCCKNLGSITSVDFNTTSVLPDKRACGIVKQQPGYKDNEAHFPWIAGIEVSTDQVNHTEIRCLGTIIHSRYILTTPRCIYGEEYQKPFDPIKVWLGRWNSSRNNANPVQKIGITKILTLNYIALILLENDIQFSDDTSPICLASPNLPQPEVGESISVLRVLQGSMLFRPPSPITTSDLIFKQEFPLIECRDPLYMFFGRYSTCNAGVIVNYTSEEPYCENNAPYGTPVMRRYEDKGSGRMQWYLVAMDKREHIVGYTNCDRILYIPDIIDSLYWIITIISENN